jgi:type II secretory pathway pseudopilin PulG
MKILTKNTHKQQSTAGFTIVELLIAAAVFSLTLLISLTGFLQMGKIFYKGVSITQTSQSSRAITDSLKADIVYASDLSGLSVKGTTRQYFCAGTNRYTFIRGNKVNTEAHDFTTQFGLVKDTLTTTGCPDPFGGGGTPLNNPVELLGDKMRLSNLTISRITLPPTALAPSNNKLYNLNVRIAYGDDDVFQGAANSTTASCASGSNVSTYCFVYDLKTTVRQGY